MALSVLAGNDHGDLMVRGTAVGDHLVSRFARSDRGYRVTAEVLRHLDTGPRSEKDVATDALHRAQRWSSEGKIRRGEAASQAIVQNAVRLAVDTGLVTRADGALSWRAGVGPVEAWIAELERELALLA